MHLTPVMERFVLHWGEMGSRWGVNRSIAQIHALLYLSDRPLPADEIVETLSIARSNVSTGLRELQSWELVQLVHVMGDRRDHFTAVKDCWEMLLRIAEGRKRREIDPTLTVLRQCAIEARDEPGLSKEARKRIEDTLGFVETLSDAYDQLSRLPRGTLMTMVRMGGGLARLVEGKKRK